MENFIYDYFIKPIWDRTGYNVVNTLVYAMIAIVAVYALNRIIRGKIKIDQNFIRSVLCFVLFGSTIRVVTDAIDTGVLKPITPIHKFVLDSHLWDYGYLTVTPGVYILTAALLLISLVILYRMKKVEWLGYVGLLLWLPNFLLLVPFMSYAVYIIPILMLAGVPTYIAWRYFKDPILALVVAGQTVDGAATFFIIDIFSKISGINYFEQHVLSNAVGQGSGTFFTFYLLKIAISFAAAYVLSKEKAEIDFKIGSWNLSMDRNYLALIIMIMGFAPGIRDILRMMVGA